MSKLTKTETIARRLTEEIASGRLEPGAQVDEVSIAARYGVSRTPIREAIRELSANGLLESRPHRGASVPDFSQQQLDEMFAVMADLEALCARAAAAAMTAAELRGLQSIVEMSRPLARSGDDVSYSAMNDRFHDAIYAGSHNGYLARLTIATGGKLMPFRRAQFLAEGRLARSQAEHERVADAITSRDPSRAFDAMRAHIVVVRTAVDAVTPAGT